MYNCWFTEYCLISNKFMKSEKNNETNCCHIFLVRFAFSIEDVRKTRPGDFPLRALPKNLLCQTMRHGRITRVRQLFEQQHSNPNCKKTFFKNKIAYQFVENHCSSWIQWNWFLSFVYRSINSAMVHENQVQKVASAHDPDRLLSSANTTHHFQLCKNN